MIDFREIVRLIPLRDYLNDIGWKRTSTERTATRGPCPIHGTSSKPGSRSFAVQTGGQVWFCHKCQIGGDVINLHSALNKMGMYEAAKDLCHRYSIVTVAKMERKGGTVKGRSQNGET